MTRADPTYLDAELAPHRSMGPRTRAGILAFLCAYNLVLALFMFSIGAFPVPVFLGLDVVAVMIAFHVVGRAGPRERVLVTCAEVRVWSRSRRAERALWTSPTAFTRVDVERSEEGVSALVLRLSGRSLRIGAMLGPVELAEFAERLLLALGDARAARPA